MFRTKCSENKSCKAPGLKSASPRVHPPISPARRGHRAWAGGRPKIFDVLTTSRRRVKGAFCSIMGQLGDAELDAILTAAWALHPSQRAAFEQAVLAELQRLPPDTRGPGTLHRIIAACQRKARPSAAPAISVTMTGRRRCGTRANRPAAKFALAQASSSCFLIGPLVRAYAPLDAAFRKMLFRCSFKVRIADFALPSCLHFSF